ncbi:MAG: CvpA family protein [Verrucomicrobia bacterium]|nr:CvpA family protein [Verrucomicrobiota bacterium]
MLIWILAGFLFLIVAALGYFQGAVRLIVSLAGMLLGAMLALPLAPTLKPVMNMMGVKHPVWSVVWPPIIVFFVVLFVFVGVAFFVQRKITLYYKYRTDDITRIRWERLNKGLGLCAGLLMGGVWVVLISLAIYVAGYLTVQVVNEDTTSSALRLISQARVDMANTGLDKAVAPFDPVSPAYYRAADILGLIYNNPSVLSRLSGYPPFLSTGTRTEFQEIATDSEFNNLLQTRGDVTQIIRHLKTQAVIYNPEIVQELLQQDAKDLHEYLLTGKSAKFDDEKILGRWRLDRYATMAQERKKRPNMSASEMARLKKMLNDYMGSVTFTATTDRKASLKVELSEQAKQILQAAQAAAAPRTQSPNPGAPAMSPEMAARYGMRPGQPGPGSAQQPATPTPAVALPKLGVSGGDGAWERQGDKYEVKLQDEKGKEHSIETLADDERMTLSSSSMFAPFSALVLVESD